MCSLVPCNGQSGARTLGRDCEKCFMNASQTFQLDKQTKNVQLMEFWI